MPKTIDQDELRKQRNRQKQKEKRLELKEIEKAKKTIEYQRMINNNRKEYGLKQKKVQLNMKSYFKSKTSSSS
ncbi:MAG: hypothetical protein CMO44_18395 [Verrucomicrobiales bacterium]|nr:hypothetical protein [Verrucomicrobiales bacterium]